jgi:hypothetical protein
MSSLGGNSPFIAKILDDDGPNGYPGTQLFSMQVTYPTGSGWRGVAVSPPITISSGGFYVAWIMVDASTRQLGMDNTTTQPVSRQSWEYFYGDSAWAPFRALEYSEPMIRARISPSLPSALDVQMVPLFPPIIIPANGGSFQFNATTQRILPPQAIYWVWARDRNPDGTYTGILLGPVPINPPVGVTVTRQRTQVVPASWPAGVHYYIGYANNVITYPAIDADSFAWTKSTTGDGGATVWEAANFGEPFPGEEVPPLSRGDRGDLITTLPNPFNATTAISYQLSTDSHVSLKVYDTMGRLIATLVNGMRDAGTHQVTFDGSKLSSGLYFVKMQAGSFSAVRKMMLVK